MEDNFALQCCVGFCHTATRISHKYTYIPFLLNLPPTPLHFSRLSQSTQLSSLCPQSNFSLAICFTHGNVCFNTTPLIRPRLSFPCCAHKSVLYVCISIPALQIGSSMPFKKRCFYLALVVVLEKTLESPLNSKEIKPVSLKGDQS